MENKITFCLIYFHIRNSERQFARSYKLVITKQKQTDVC